MYSATSSINALEKYISPMFRVEEQAHGSSKICMLVASSPYSLRLKTEVMCFPPPTPKTNELVSIYLGSEQSKNKNPYSHCCDKV
jgi:hypothetical protein